MIRWLISALSYLLLTCAALAQVGQIPAWPPTQFIASGGGCSQATSFLSRVASVPATLDATHSTAYTNLICGLVTDGVWTKLDGLYILATNTVTGTNTSVALLNLVSASFSPATPSNGPTFTADRGYTGNGSNASLSTGFNPSTAGGNWTLNSAHMSVWQVTVGANQSDIGTSGDIIMPNFSGNTFMWLDAGTGGGAIAADPSNNGIGHYISSRTSSTNRDGYKNGASLGNANSSTTTALSNSNVLLLGATANSFTAGQVAESSMGGALTSTDATNFYNRLRTYMTAVGVP